MSNQLLAVGVCLLAFTPCTAQEWTRFRGPNGSGVHATAKVPTEWKSFAWKTPLPGVGHSSPVIWGERIFVTAAEPSGKRWLVCVNAVSGAVLWQRDFPGEVYKTHKRNSRASSTPVVDGERVYVLWGSPKQLLAMAVDHQGKTVWEVNLGTYKGGHGYAVSPILFEKLLIIPNEQDKGGSLLALDAATGKKKWEVPRIAGVAHYSTPCIYEAAKRPPELIFTNWKHGITAVEPRTGKVLWETSVFEPELQERAIVSPIIAGDLIIGTCGFVTAQKHFVAVRPMPEGQAQEIWRIEKQVAHIPTPLVKLPYIFSLTEKGNLSCIEAATGKVLSQERLDNSFSASPVWANGHLYCVADDGEVFVVKADEKLQTVSRPQLGEASHATPAIAEDRIIFRTERQVMAVARSR